MTPYDLLVMKIYLKKNSTLDQIWFYGIVMPWRILWLFPITITVIALYILTAISYGITYADMVWHDVWGY